MKFLLPALLFFELSASADPADVTKVTSPDKTFLVATRRIPEDEYIWRLDLDSTRLVILPLNKNDELGELYAAHTITGRLVSELHWSPDSKFVVLTTASSGGHSPYHFETFVFCVADKSLRYMDDVTGIVLDPAFHFEAPDVAVMTARDETHELLTSGDRKTVKIPLSETVKKMKVR